MVEASRRGKPISQEQRDTLARSRGSIWFDIEPYVRVGMTADEIRLSVKLEKNIELPYKKIDNILGKRQKRGIPSRKPFERSFDRIDALHRRKRGGEVFAERIRTWTTLMKLLEERGLMDKPQGRMDWVVLVEAYHTRRLRARSEPAYNLFPEIPDEVYIEVLGRQKECMEAIRKATPLNGTEATRISNAMATHGEFRVDEARGR